MTELMIGKVKHYYPKVHAAVVELERGMLKVGDKIHIVGSETDIWETVRSLQLDHRPVPQAWLGQSVGVLVPERARDNARVFKVVE
jgi:translation elongation factor EF-Tu-like GTPase